MPTLEIPHYELLDRLFSLVAEEHTELLPACRWLVLGPRLATLLTVGEAPTLEQLVTLRRLLHRRREPALEDLGRSLAANSEHREAAEIEICLDLLLERPDWHHPTQVLDPPIPDFARLLAAARARRRDRPAGIGRVIERLEVAVDIARNARARRQRMRRGRPRR